MAKKAHVSEQKKKSFAQLESEILKHKIIGLADITNLPSAQLQRIKFKVRDKIKIKVYNKNILKLALKSHKDRIKGLEDLIPFLDKGIPAIVLSDLDTFKMSKLINKSKSKANAKTGQIAPIDIVVPAGPTQFAAGPMIGEFGQMGIKTIVEGGKISIREETTLVPQGKVISAKQADLMSKLGIKPMDIGLKIIGVLQDGLIYEGSILSVDESFYLNELKKAYMESLGLAIHIAYPSKETINELLKKAYYEEDALQKKLNLGFESALQEDTSLIDDKKQDSKVNVKEVKSHGGIPQYSEEMAQKAQEVIEKMKDEDLKHKL